LQVQVRFFTTLREITGRKEQILKFKDDENATVKSVLNKLAKRYGNDFVDYVCDQKTGEVKGHLQFLINGRSTSTFKGLDSKLTDGDVLAIIPPVGGG
jgi:molybdopterin synthase sulfur carrier subunit